MDAYAQVKSGKLVLKGLSDKPKKRKHKSHKSGEGRRGAKAAKSAFTEDLDAHDGWWGVSKFSDIIGPVAIELTGLAPSNPTESADSEHEPTRFTPAYYLVASDDGFINLGPPRKEGEAPAPEEIFTAVRVSDTKLAFKTGSVPPLRTLHSRSNA